MARNVTNKKLVISVVVSAMVVLIVGSTWLISLWSKHDPSVYVDQATEACRAGEMINAIRAYSQAYRQTLDPSWIVESGLVARSFGDASRALRLFDKAVAANPALRDAHHNRLELRLEMIRLEADAEGYANLRKDAEALLTLDAKNARALLAKSIALAGLVQEDPDHVEQSLEDIQKAHEIAPKDVEIADVLARRYEDATADQNTTSSKSKKTPARAEDVYRGLIVAVPDDARARLRYGRFLLRRLEARQTQAAARGTPLGSADTKKSLESIRELLDKARQLDPKDGEIALAWCDYLSLVGRSDKAIEALAGAVQSAPDELRLYVELAGRLLAASRSEEAEKVLRKGLDRPFDRDSYLGLLNRPIRYRLWCMLGQCYLQELVPGSKPSAEMIVKAEHAHEQAGIELSSDHWLGRMLQGRIDRARGKRLATVARFREADRMLDWQLNPADKLAVKLELVELQIELDGYGSARESLADIRQHRPNHAAATAMRAWIDLKLGHAETAATHAGLALKGLARGERTARSRPTSALSSGKSDLLRRCLLTRWVACRIEGMLGDAGRAEKRLSPLAAGDWILLADQARRHASLKGSKKLSAMAEQAYLAGIKADPTQVEAVRRLATLYALQNRQEKVLEVTGQAIRALGQLATGKDAVSVGTSLARLTALQARLDPGLDDEKRRERAVAALSSVKDPVRRAELLADCYISIGSLDEAVKQLSAAAKARPDDIALLEQWFSAALAAGDWSTADDARKRATELDADGAGGRLYDGRLELARALQLQAEAEKKKDKDPDGARKDQADAADRLSMAVDSLRAGAEEASGMSMARVWLGQALQASGRDGARDAFETALVLNPLNAEANRELARMGQAKTDSGIDAEKHLGEAILLSTKTLDGMPADPWLRRQARDIFERKHPAESIKRREAHRIAKPNDADNLLRLGLLYRDVGRKKEADQRLSEAVKAGPKNIELHERIARLYRLDKRYAEATKLLADLVSRLKGPQQAQALLVKARHLANVMVVRQTLGGTSTELAELRDKVDEAFESAHKIGATPEICLAASDFCLLTQRRTKAAEWLRNALRIRQHKLDERPIRQKLIRTLLSIRPLPEEVEREIADYDARFQGWEEVSLFWGMLQAARGKLDEAVEQHTRYLDRLLREKDSAHIKPGQLAQAYYLRGRLYLRLAIVGSQGSKDQNQNQNPLQLAIDDLSQAKTSSPSAVERSRYAIALAKAMEKAGKTEAAIRELRAVVEEHSDDSGAARELAIILGRTKKHRAAQEKLIRRQMQLNPKHWQWPFLLGQTLERRGAAREAERAYRAAAELCEYGARGKGGNAVVAVLRLMARRGDFPGIVSLIETHIKPDQRNYVILTYYGASLVRGNRVDEALAAWTTACNAVIKAQEQISISEAMVLILGKERAIQAARQMVKRSPGNVRPMMLLAIMLNRTGRRDEAFVLMDKAAPVATRPADKAGILTLTGTLKLLDGKGKEAAEFFRQALEIDKDNEISLNNLAHVLVEDLNRPKEALTYARRAAELKPDSPNVLDTLGWCLSQAGECQAAAGVLSEAYGKRPTAAISYHLAETYRRIKNLESARETAEKGLELAKLTKDKKHQAKLQKLLDEIKNGG